MGNWEVNKPNLSEIPTDSDAISRHAAMETFNRWAEFKDYTHVERHILHAVVDEIRAMPSISEQHDEWTPILKDLYDGMAEMGEQAAELATKTCNKQIASKLEDAGLARDSEETCNNKQVISKLVASEDAISRQAEIDAAIDGADDWDVGYNPTREEYIKKAINALPSVNPKPKTGHWIIHNESITLLTGGTATGGVICSECGYKTHNKAHAIIGCPYNYCPNCGAKMVEPQEREEQA